MSTERERRLEPGTVSELLVPLISSARAPPDTFEKQESTDAARSRLSSGTARYMSWTKVSRAVLLAAPSSDARTFSSELPVGSTKKASCRDMERLLCGRVGGSSLGGWSSNDGAPGDGGGDCGGGGATKVRGGGGGASNTRGDSVSLSSSSSSSSAEDEARGLSGVTRSSLRRASQVSMWRQWTHGGGVPLPDRRRDHSRGTWCECRR